MEAGAERSGALAAIGLLLAAAGRLLVAVGCLLVVAGLLYCATGWRYGAVIAIWAAEWGLPLIGVGIGFVRFGRRGTSVMAFCGGLGGILLIVLGEMSRAYDSYPVAGAIGAAAILIGIASALSRRRRKLSPPNSGLQQTPPSRSLGRRS
jgi:hypothetical protein